MTIRQKEILTLRKWVDKHYEEQDAITIFVYTVYVYCKDMLCKVACIMIHPQPDSSAEYILLTAGMHNNIKTCNKW